MNLRSMFRRRRGQALAEFALLLPAVAALMIGIVEFGGAFHSYQVVTHASREAGRLAITPDAGDAEVDARIRGILEQASLDPALAEIELSLQTASGSADTVVIRYPHAFSMLAPVVGLLKREDQEGMPGSIMLRAMFVMRNE